MQPNQYDQHTSSLFFVSPISSNSFDCNQTDPKKNI